MTCKDYRSIGAFMAAGALLTAVVAAVPAAGRRHACSAIGLAESQQLSLGDKLAEDLPRGADRICSIALKLNEYIRLEASGWDAGIVVSILGPDSAPISAEVCVEENPTCISWISAVEGKHGVHIKPVDPDSVLTRYEIRMVEKRSAVETDRLRISAEKDYLEAMRLQKTFTQESDRLAVEHLKDALRLWTKIGDRKNMARIICCLGDLMEDRGRFSEALAHYKNALRISQETEDKRGVLEARIRMGLIEAQTGNGKQALDLIESSLQLSRDIGDQPGEALALANLGEAYYWMGRMREALACHQQSAQLWRNIGNRRRLARALFCVGCTNADLSDVAKAFEQLNQSLRLWRGIGDRHGEAKVLTQIGALFGRVGEKQEAINRFRLAAEIFQGGSEPLGEAILTNAMAYAYHSLGYPEVALDHYNRALRIHRQIGFPNGEAGQLVAIGEIYYDRGDNPAALECFGKSLVIFKKIEDSQMQAQSLRNIGIVQRTLGNVRRAIDCFEQGLALSQASGDLRAQSLALKELGLAYQDTGSAQKSLDYLQDALALNREAMDPFGEVEIRYHTARAWRDLGGQNEALTQMEKSLEIIESLRSKVVVPSLRISYFSTIRRNYEFYVNLLMDIHGRQPGEGRDAVAFQVSERARARNLLDLLRETRSGIREGIQPSLVARERDLSRLLNAKAQRQIQLMSSEHSQAEANSLAAEIRELNNEYDQLQAEIRTRHPNYAALTQPQPLSMQEIRDGVLDDKTLLLEYSLGEEHSYMWVVTRRGMTSHELPARDKIEDMARQARGFITARQQRLPGETASQFFKRTLDTDAKYWKVAGQLSRILLGPVAEKLEDHRILIVADGLLQYLPFAALPVPRTANTANADALLQGPPTPLVAEHEVISLPSASTLAVLRRQVEGRKQAPMSVAVMADPVFQRDDPRLKPTATAPTARKAGTEADSGGSPMRGSRRSTVFPALREGLEYFRLIYSGREAEDIVSAAAPGTSSSWVGLQANREQAMSQELAHYRIVHFATHGVIDDIHPNLSGIVLSMVDAKGTEQDGFLRLLDIYNLNLPAELVVLSACNTGLGKDVRGEGFIGLVRGFMYAGAARVVSSLWRVDDQSTAELMKRFYRGMLKDGLSPAAALRAAQVEMSKLKQWSAPYHWAAFVLQGEYR
jgi:CHAT domain-containing protein